MKRLVPLMVAVLLSACVGGTRHVEVDNPYIGKYRSFSQTGMAAMQRERWAYAQSVFARALEAAQLTDSPGLIAQAWYNLGMARRSAGQAKAASEAFRSAWETAGKANDPVTALRARLALALSPGQPAWHPGTLQANLPPDIHLSAARLAELQHRPQAAQYEYLKALKRSGKSRQGLIYKGQANLGLGLLASARNDREEARQRMRQALAAFRRVGEPRLIAYTLLRLSESDAGKAARADDIHHALTIYRVMRDEAGQAACLQALKSLGEGSGRLDSVRHPQGAESRQ